MIYGYARVSTEAQDLAYQLDKLAAAGCTRIFYEKRSGKSTHDRPQLDALLGTLRQGDVMLATVTDRVARDPLDMLNILHAVKAAGAGLRLLDEPFIDTTSELADLVLFIMGWAARWHRRRILENTANGRALAKARGVKFGRKPKLSVRQKQDVLLRLERGETIAQVAQAYRVSYFTIFRIPRSGSP